MFTGYKKCYNSSQMIRTEHFCDWHVHCEDDSDEHHCKTKGCVWANKWQCVHEDECIFQESVCDGSPDCDDESDEDIEVCTNWKCGANKINFYGIDKQA